MSDSFLDLSPIYFIAFVFLGLEIILAFNRYRRTRFLVSLFLGLQILAAFVAILFYALYTFLDAASGALADISLTLVTVCFIWMAMIMVYIFESTWNLKISAFGIFLWGFSAFILGFSLSQRWFWLSYLPGYGWMSEIDPSIFDLLEIYLVCMAIYFVLRTIQFVHKKIRELGLRIIIKYWIWGTSFLGIAILGVGFAFLLTGSSFRFVTIFLFIGFPTIYIGYLTKPSAYIVTSAQIHKIFFFNGQTSENYLVINAKKWVSEGLLGATQILQEISHSALSPQRIVFIDKTFIIETIRIGTQDVYGVLIADKEAVGFHSSLQYALKVLVNQYMDFSQEPPTCQSEKFKSNVLQIFDYTLDRENFSVI